MIGDGDGFGQQFAHPECYRLLSGTSRLVIRDLRRPCDAPDCQRDATQRVNLSFLVDYMVKNVCFDNIRWAEQDLQRYVPMDR
jgi:hypothetical protein